MPLGPSSTEMLARARTDLRLGVPVILMSERGAVLTVPAEEISDERLALMRNMGQPELALSNWRAETLHIPAYDGDIARIAVPTGADAGWVHAVADPSSDLIEPLKGPFTPIREGNADLHRAAIKLNKTARLLPASVIVRLKEPGALADGSGLTTIDIDALGDRLTSVGDFSAVISAKVPLAASKIARVQVFRPDDGGEEHYAVEIGKPNRKEPVLARLHSACFTGDILGSLKCDCGPQLQTALAEMGRNGSGVLLYLNQEGRGIGLANKLRAYSLQEQGFDTVEANHRLGFEDDERDFEIGATILKKLGFSSVRLMTNNPRKVEMLQSHDVAVTERVPLKAGENPLNTGYLKTKADKSGHLL